MSPWRLAAADPATGAWQPRPVRAGDSVWVRPAAGAEAARLLWMRDEHIAAVLELPVRSHEPAQLKVEATSPLRLWADGRPIFHLPAKTVVRPARPWNPAKRLELALLIDATQWATRPAGEDPAPPERLRLLSDPELRIEPFRAWIEGIQALKPVFPEGIAVSIVAFGDQAPPYPVAEDLQPTFVVSPDIASLRFEAAEPTALLRRLSSLEPSPGGDAVDAVADGLHACVSLPWSADARRLVILIGDSPGYSLLHPGPTGTAAFPRRLDVDSVTIGLFDSGIELATVFNTLDTEADTDIQRRLVQHTRSQYRSLASRPSLSFVHSPDRPLNPTDWAQALSRRWDWSGRGACPAFWTEEQP